MLLFQQCKYEYIQWDCITFRREDSKVVFIRSTKIQGREGRGVTCTARTHGAMPTLPTTCGGNSLVCFHLGVEWSGKQQSMVGEKVEIMYRWAWTEGCCDCIHRKDNKLLTFIFYRKRQVKKEWKIKAWQSWITMEFELLWVQLFKDYYGFVNFKKRTIPWQLLKQLCLHGQLQSAAGLEGPPPHQVPTPTPDPFVAPLLQALKSFSEVAKRIFCLRKFFSTRNIDALYKFCQCS